MLDGSKKICEEAINYDNYDYIFETRLDINYTSKLDLTEFNNPESTTNLTILSNISVKFILSFADV